MKELVTSQVKDQQRSVRAETNAGKWDPPEMGTNKQVSKMAPSHHGPAYSPKTEYGLGAKKQVTSMDILKELTYGLLTLVHLIMWHLVTRDVETRELQLGLHTEL
jgi:hypothetical protein